MFRLYYASKPQETIHPAMVKEILLKAKKNNAKLNVTGALFYNPSYFLQCLEGDRANVFRIFNKISNDPRHHSLEIIYAIDIDQRLFSEWSMGIASQTSDNERLFFKFLPSKDFNPYELGSRGVEGFFNHMKHTVTILTELSEREAG